MSPSTTNPRVNISAFDLNGLTQLQTFIAKFGPILTVLDSIFENQLANVPNDSLTKLERFIDIISSEICDRMSRKQNLIFKNVPKAVSNVEFGQVLMSMYGKPITITSIKRLRSRSRNQPILVTLNSLATVEEILHHNKVFARRFPWHIYIYTAITHQLNGDYHSQVSIIPNILILPTSETCYVHNSILQATIYLNKLPLRQMPHTPLPAK